MKLVVIYGPPAAGKLTVAKELAKLTGYRLFHNHMTLDVVDSVINSRSKLFWDTVKDFRINILRAAAREKVHGVIFTMCYDRNDYSFFRRLFRTVEKEKAKVYLVHLHASLETLMKRVQNRSRKKYRKMKDPQKLVTESKKYDSYTPYPGRASLRIDNTKLSAKRVAKMIQQHYEL